jgi:paraquat-inducible protein B
MSGTPAPRPSAVVRTPTDRRRRLSAIWVIPLVTLVIGAWLAWKTLTERGPLITVTFDSAAGLQVAQSHVRHKEVDMGTVEAIALTPDLKRVQVTVRMRREAEPLLTEGTQFWVVRPRFFAGSISGLSTLFSGSYIDMLPSRGGTGKRDFTGLEDPPVLKSDEPGRTFLLKAKRIGSLNLGSPIMFRDLEAGEVLGWDVGEMAREVTVHAFIRAPFDKYVRDDSRFWNASGLSVRLGGNGLQVQMESLRAVVLGGIAFETPDVPGNAPESAPNHAFTLFTDKEAADASAFKHSLPFLALVTGSVAGLAPKAPVTLRGLKIGEVESLGLMYDKVADTVVVPVHFTLEPERIALLDLPADDMLGLKLDELVRRGLRVKLESSSILTGSKQLALDLFPNAPRAELTRQDGIYVLPMLGGGSEDAFAAAASLLNKLNDMPFEAIGQNLNQALSGASTLLNDRRLAESVAELRATLAGAQTLVANLNKGVAPLSQRAPAIAAGLESAVKRTDALLGSIDSGYGGNSRFSRDVAHLMTQLSDAARSLRVLADLLSRHPEALIRGRTDTGSP